MKTKKNALTKKQKYKEFIKPYLWNIPLFFKDVLKTDLDPWQCEASQAFLDQTKAAVVGCNGSGKDFLMGGLPIFFLMTRPDTKGQVTGPSQNQVQDVVWSEMWNHMERNPSLHKFLKWEKTHLRDRERPETTFFVAKTASKRYSKGTGDIATEGVQGVRGRWTVVLITEGSGVEASNFEGAESTLTVPNSYIFVVGNALRREGRLYEYFTNPAYSDWYLRHVPYTEAPHADRKKLEKWIEIYGIDSMYVQVRCFAQFPKEGAPDIAISWTSVNEAMAREKPTYHRDDMQIGVDVAREGDDEAVITPRVGSIVYPQKIFPKCKGPFLVGKILETVEEYGGDKDTLIMVDETGMGGIGVVDPLTDTYNYTNVVGCHNAWKPIRKDKYDQWDDEQWMEAIPAFLEYGVLPFEDILLRQLTTRKYGFTGKRKAQRRLENKKVYKARTKNSPDRAESLMLAVAQNPYTMPGFDVRVLGEEPIPDNYVEAELEREGVYWPGG